MISTLSTLVGGIGLFLLGMTLMTDGLKAVAGDALRSMLADFTGSRIKALLTGAGITALVQSSSATTLATIGFVSAGLLTFSNSIGVIIGANLGTTSTGWIVSLLGLKFSIGTVLLPLIGVGALMRLLGRGGMAHAGSALAGFGVIFVGIDVMQGGMAGLAGQVDLSQYSTADIQARLMLVVIGTIMTVLMQSSSAAVATTLTALAAGTISVEQAAALVIGQNVGTTVTACIAAIGASVPARRTAFVHVLFNFGTGTIAFFLLPIFVAGVDVVTERWVGREDALTIAAFHTAFNLLGVAVFFPLTSHLAAWATHLFPENRPRLTRNQDLSMCSVPSLAIEAAHDTLRECTAIILLNAAVRLRGEEQPHIEVALAEVRQAIEETGNFLARLPSVETALLGRLTAVLHVMDHAMQCAEDAEQLLIADPVRTMPALRDQADRIEALFMMAVESVRRTRSADLAGLILQFEQSLASSADARPVILQSAARHTLSIDEALDSLDVQRSIDRLMQHAARSLYYLHQLSQRTPDMTSLAEVDIRTH